MKQWGERNGGKPFCLVTGNRNAKNEGNAGNANNANNENNAGNENNADKNLI